MTARGARVGTTKRVVVSTAGTPVQVEEQGGRYDEVWITGFRSNTQFVTWGFSNAVRAADASENGQSVQSKQTNVLLNIDISTLWLDSEIDGEGAVVVMFKDPEDK
jgi:hypothetical protein